jgi:HPt (histidine-containing phosphotransfer) domain-containing protein
VAAVLQTAPEPSPTYKEGLVGFMRRSHDLLQTAETWLALAEFSAADDDFHRASAQATIAIAQILLALAYAQQKRPRRFLTGAPRKAAWPLAGGKV